MSICFLIDSVPLSEECAAGRFARLRGACVMRCEDPNALPGQISQPSMIALCPSHLQEFSCTHRSHIANLVGQGATLYVRGLLRGHSTLDLMPFASMKLVIAPEMRVVSYRFTASPMIPAVLADEQVPGVLFEACAP